jgi:hypothetical protein
LDAHPKKHGLALIPLHHLDRAAIVQHFLGQPAKASSAAALRVKLPVLGTLAQVTARVSEAEAAL